MNDSSEVYFVQQIVILIAPEETVDHESPTNGRIMMVEELGERHRGEVIFHL